MPKIRTKRSRVPDGFDVVEPTLLSLERRMREVESEPHEGKRKAEALWPVFRIAHQRSRYVYDMFYAKAAISREVYDFCLKEGYADGALIAKWKKPGYERLCCLQCVSQRDHTHGGTCICRVPRKDLEPGKIFVRLFCTRGCGLGGGREFASRPPPHLTSRRSAPAAGVGAAAQATRARWRTCLHSCTAARAGVVAAVARAVAGRAAAAGVGARTTGRARALRLLARLRVRLRARLRARLPKARAGKQRRRKNSGAAKLKHVSSKPGRVRVPQPRRRRRRRRRLPL